MASRAMREGSVGLLIVGGIALFVGLVAWLQDVRIGRRSYEVTVEFINARGLQVGTPVNYRGIQVGKVRSITPTTRQVDVVMEISRLDVLLPKRTRIEAQSSALLGETALDILPLTSAPEPGAVPGPLAPDCDPELILCNGSRIAGSTVADLTDLVRSMNEVAALINNPELLETLRGIASDATSATQGVSQLTRDLSGLSRSLQGEVGNLSNTLTAAGAAATAAGNAATTVDATARQLGGVATQASGLADQTSGLVGQASSLIEQNREALNRALVNVGQAGVGVRSALADLRPILSDVRSRDLVGNLDQLTQNVTEVATNLQQATQALNDPQTILLLQQTLDAARVTFQNAQKLTSDLDEVTGDPAFRTNLRRLINGLSGLVSSTQQLEQQVVLAHRLSPQLPPQQSQRLARLNAEVNLASLALINDLSQLSQALDRAAAAQVPAVVVPSAPPLGGALPNATAPLSPTAGTSPAGRPDGVWGGAPGESPDARRPQGGPTLRRGLPPRAN